MNAIAPSLNLNGCFPTFGSNIVFLAFVSLLIWETRECVVLPKLIHPSSLFVDDGLLLVVMILLLSKGAQHCEFRSKEVVE